MWGLSLTALIAMFFVYGNSLTAFAQNPLTEGFEKAAEGSGLPKNTVTPEKFVGGLVEGALAILGVVFLILVVYGGIQWMVAEGDPKKVGKARGLIFHAIVGLIIVFSAYAITYFVVKTIIDTTL